MPSPPETSHSPQPPGYRFFQDNRQGSIQGESGNGPVEGGVHCRVPPARRRRRCRKRSHRPTARSCQVSAFQPGNAAHSLFGATAACRIADHASELKVDDFARPNLSSGTARLPAGVLCNVASIQDERSFFLRGRIVDAASKSHCPPVSARTSLILIHQRHAFRCARGSFPESRPRRTGPPGKADRFPRTPPAGRRPGGIAWACTTRPRSDVGRDFRLTREPQAQALVPGRRRSSNDRIVSRCSALTSGVIPMPRRSWFGKGLWRLR